MSAVGQNKKHTQARIIALFQQRLGYDYLGNLTGGENRNIDTELLTGWPSKQEVGEALIAHALHELNRVSTGSSKSIYDRNREVCELLRYGVKAATRTIKS
jgi:type I restriction enzyme R subunit